MLGLVVVSVIVAVEELLENDLLVNVGDWAEMGAVSLALARTRGQICSKLGRNLFNGPEWGC